MRLLRTDCEELKLDIHNDEGNIPKYGILSHVWFAAEQEITFQDLGKDSAALTEKVGWAKLDFARKQAYQDGLLYVWIDTCCIDKSSSAELAESVNSMYRWYNLAEVCYVYLADMPEPVTLAHSATEKQQTYAWDWDAYGRSQWFTRGWTLQEMMAPANVRFYSSSWKYIGSLSKLATRIADATGVHIDALRREWPVASYSIAQRMSWAANRQTTKAEDRAYSLLGLFELNLPIIYGEGDRAFLRLQEELLKRHSDQSIFAWLAVPGERVALAQAEQLVRKRGFGILATSPTAFKSCRRIVPLEQGEQNPARNYELTDGGIQFTLPSFGLLDDPRAHKRMLRNASYFPDKMEVALRCCYEDDCTNVLVMALAKAQENTNLYYVLPQGNSVHRIQKWSTPKPWDPHQLHVTRTFVVMRTTPRPEKQRPRQADRNTIICELKQCPNFWLHSRISQSVPAVSWSYDSLTFSLPTNSNTSGGGQQFRGQFLLRVVERTAPRFTAVVKITASRNENDEDWSCRVELQQYCKTRPVVIPYTANTQMGIDIPGRHTVSTTVCYRTLVNQRIIVVRLQVDEMFSMANLRMSCQFLFWALVAFMMLPCTVLLPVLVLKMVRQRAYESFRRIDDTAFTISGADIGFTTSEVVVLGVGLPITCIIGACLLLGSKIYLMWKPLSWQVPMLWLLRLISLIVGSLLMTDPLGMQGGSLWDYSNKCAGHQSSNFCTQLAPLCWLTTIRLTALLSIDSLTTAVFLRLSLRARWHAKGRGYIRTLVGLIFPALLNTATLLPCLLFALEISSVVAPWTNAACQTRHIPGPSASFFLGSWFEAIADLGPWFGTFATNHGYYHNCSQFSILASRLWVYITLGFWQLGLECLAIFQSICLEPRSEEELTSRRNALQRLIDTCVHRRPKARRKAE